MSKHQHKTTKRNSHIKYNMVTIIIFQNKYQKILYHKYHIIQKIIHQKIYNIIIQLLNIQYITLSKKRMPENVTKITSKMA